MKIEFDFLKDRFVSEDVYQESEGVRVPHSVKDPLIFLDSLKDYRYQDSDINKIISLCKKVYKYEGVIGSAIDSLVELSITNLRVGPTGNKKADKIIKNFIRDVNFGSNQFRAGINELSFKIALEYFRSGNVFLYEYWGEIKTDGGPYSAPRMLLILDPEKINLPSTGDKIGNQPIYYQKTMENNDLLMKDGRTVKDAIFIKRLLKGTELDKVRRRVHTAVDGYELNSNNITHIKRKAQDYEKWGIPYLARALQHVSDLQKLRRLDESTIEGLINLLTIFKIGSDERPAKQSRLRAFSNLIKDPKATQWLVWAHDVSVEQVGPDGKILTMKDKYLAKYEEIFMSLGIPPLLFGISQKGGKEDIYNQVLVLTNKLKHLRDIISDYYCKIFTKICRVNLGVTIYPVIEWDDISLNKDVMFKQFVLGLYDRGLLDPQQVIEKAGFDFDSVVNRFKEFTEGGYEEKYGISVPPQLPFSGNQPGTQNVDNKVVVPNDNKKHKEINPKPPSDKEKVKANAKLAISKLDNDSKIDVNSAIANFKNSTENIINTVQFLEEKNNKTGFARKIDFVFRSLCRLYERGYRGSYNEKIFDKLSSFIDGV